MLSESAATPAPLKTGNGQAELAEGLMLVRASTLKILRLQLAMERRDRRSAMETVDELVALDRNLAECLAAVPLAPDQAGLALELDHERAALNREKLTLTAQVITREPWVEPPAASPPPEPVEPEPALAEPVEGPAEELWFADVWDEELPAPVPRRRVLWWLLGLMLVVVSSLAAAAFLLGLPPEVARLMPAFEGFL